MTPVQQISPVFLRSRLVAFALISFISFVWIVLLSLDLAWESETMDPYQEILIAVMILNNTITVIMLIILLILPFRAWLDAARFMFLMMTHIGIAGAFSYWSPRFKCPSQTPDQEGVCNLFKLYVLVANWVIPLLLYVAGLSLMVYRCSRTSLDFDTCDSRQPLPPTSQLAISNPVNIVSSPRTSKMSRLSSTVGISRFSTSTARLSKPVPLTNL